MAADRAKLVAAVDAAEVVLQAAKEKVAEWDMDRARDK